MTAKTSRAELRALAKKAPEGPWFAGEDPAEDAPVHGNSLAMVDTGRESDWPVARLTEWHTAEYLAAVDPQTVIGLIDDLKMASMKIELLSKELAQSDAVIAQVVAMNDKQVPPGVSAIFTVRALYREAKRKERSNVQ